MLRLEDRLEAPCAVLKSRDITWVQKESPIQQPAQIQTWSLDGSKDIIDRLARTARAGQRKGLGKRLQQWAWEGGIAGR